jgi:hypothetical protein
MYAGITDNITECTSTTCKILEVKKCYSFNTCLQLNTIHDSLIKIIQRSICLPTIFFSFKLFLASYPIQSIRVILSSIFWKWKIDLVSQVKCVAQWVQLCSRQSDEIGKHPQITGSDLLEEGSFTAAREILHNINPMYSQAVLTNKFDCIFKPSWTNLYHGNIEYL